MKRICFALCYFCDCEKKNMQMLQVLCPSYSTKIRKCSALVNIINFLYFYTLLSYISYKYHKICVKNVRKLLYKQIVAKITIVCAKNKIRNQVRIRVTWICGNAYQWTSWARKKRKTVPQILPSPIRICSCENGHATRRAETRKFITILKYYSERSTRAPALNYA